MDTPRASGFAVLELSKVHMLKVHYDYYKKTYGDKARLVFTDTDSLCYLIQTADPILDMINAKWPDFDIIGALTPHKMAELCGGDRDKIAKLTLDLLIERAEEQAADLISAVREGLGKNPKPVAVFEKLRELSTVIFSKALAELTGADAGKIEKLTERFLSNKGKLGAMKLETKECIMAVFIGLASKLYSFKSVSPGGEVSFCAKGKGVPGRVFKANCLHEDFERMLFNPHKSEVTFKGMRSFKQQNSYFESTKRDLTAFNDKVFQISETESRPLGHRLNRP